MYLVVTSLGSRQDRVAGVALVLESRRPVGNRLISNVSRDVLTVPTTVPYQRCYQDASTAAATERTVPYRVPHHNDRRHARHHRELQASPPTVVDRTHRSLPHRTTLHHTAYHSRELAIQPTLPPPVLPGFALGADCSTAAMAGRSAAQGPGSSAAGRQAGESGVKHHPHYLV